MGSLEFHDEQVLLSYILRLHKCRIKGRGPAVSVKRPFRNGSGGLNRVEEVRPPVWPL